MLVNLNLRESYSIGYLNILANSLANINKTSHKLENPITGVYINGEFPFNFDKIIDYKSMNKIKEDEYGWTSPIQSGVCDNYQQVLNKYSEYVNDPNRKFVIGLTPVVRENQESSGGWRWEKWGEYIGDFIPQCDYLYDEPEIEIIYTFQIFEIE